MKGFVFIEICGRPGVPVDMLEELGYSLMRITQNFTSLRMNLVKQQRLSCPRQACRWTC